MTVPTLTRRLPSRQLPLLAVFFAAACGPAGGTPSRTGTEGSSGSTPAEGSGGTVSSSGGSGGSSESEGTGGIPVGPSGQVSKRAACRAYVTAACLRISECNGTDPASCLDLLDHCPDYFFSPGSLRTVENILACVEPWRNFSCVQYQVDRYPDCAIPGSLPPGSPCTYVSQCDTNECSTAGQDACGICLRFAEPGEDCTAEGVTCRPGEQCGASRMCEPISAEYVETPPQLTEVAAGEACSSSLQCPETAGCVQDATAGSARCLLLPEAGQPCAVEGPYGSIGSLCSEGTYCANGESICRPDPPAGQACGSSMYGQVCADGTHCDAATTTCLADVPAGGSCKLSSQGMSSAECAGDLVCGCADEACGAGVCGSLREEGEDCSTANTLCALGTECQGGICVALDVVWRYDAVCGG